MQIIDLISDKIEYYDDVLDTHTVQFYTETGFFIISTLAYLEEAGGLEPCHYTVDDDANRFIGRDEQICIYADRLSFIFKTRTINVSNLSVDNIQTFLDFAVNRLFLRDKVKIIAIADFKLPQQTFFREAML